MNAVTVTLLRAAFAAALLLFGLALFHTLRRLGDQ